MRGKRGAKNVSTAKVEEEEYSVDEITTLLTAGKAGRGKKQAIQEPEPIIDENVVVADDVAVAVAVATKPKGRGRKAAAKVEASAEKMEAAVTKINRKRAVSSNAVSNETQLKRGRKINGPVTADDETQENGNVTEAEIAPKTNNRRGRKQTSAVETSDVVPVKATKGRGKKAMANNSEPARVSARLGKTPVKEIVPKATTTKSKKEVKTELENIVEEETLLAKKPAAKRNKKKVDEPVEESTKKETKARVAKKPVAEEISKPVAIKKPRANKNKALPTHITADEEVVPEVADKKSRKRAAAKEDTNNEEDVKKALKNATVTDYDKEAFAMKKEHTLKISSWNVAGMRSWLKKEGLKFLDYEQPDILCLQETKCEEEQLPIEAVNVNGYHRYWLCMPGGYAGVAIYSRIMPIHIEYGIGNEEFDKNGRIITAEYEKFYLINVYVPNSGRKLVNLDTRMKWEELFLAHVQRYDKMKPVIICGDMNVSHQEIDLANPKANTRNAGFTAEERDKMTQLLAAGFVDTYRHLYPEKTGAYTFWTYMGSARKRNVGWRLDYFLTSQRILSRVVEQELRTSVLGSDHCPLTLFLNI